MRSLETRFSCAEKLRLSHDQYDENLSESGREAFTSMASPDLRALLSDSVPYTSRPNREVAFGLAIDEDLQSLLATHGRDKLCEFVDANGVVIIKNQPLDPEKLPLKRWSALPEESSGTNLFWHTDHFYGDSGILVLHQPQQDPTRKSETGITAVEDLVHAIAKNLHLLNGFAVKDGLTGGLSIFSSMHPDFPYLPVANMQASMQNKAIPFHEILHFAQGVQNVDKGEAFFAGVNSTLLRGDLQEGKKAAAYFHQWNEPNTTLLISHNYVHCRRKSDQEGGQLYRAHL